MALSRRIGAKVNLFLDVCSRRADGYHEIRTVFVPVERPADTLTVEPVSGSTEIACSHPDVPCDETNLCMRAARAFGERLGRPVPVRMFLEKEIPVAAGLGGGSADAGAALDLLNRLAGEPFDEAALCAIGAGIGADVPFFVRGRPALGEGIGDRLSPLPLACDIPIVVVNPAFPVPVAWAYEARARCDAPAPPPLRQLTDAMAAGDLEGIAGSLHNALGYPVERKFPLIGMIREFLAECGCAGTLVSGSGSSVFGIARALPAGLPEAVAERFGPRVRTFVTRAPAFPG